jgi:hypothetical protein
MAERTASFEMQRSEREHELGMEATTTKHDLGMEALAAKTAAQKQAAKKPKGNGARA